MDWWTTTTGNGVPQEKYFDLHFIGHPRAHVMRTNCHWLQRGSTLEGNWRAVCRSSDNYYLCAQHCSLTRIGDSFIQLCASHRFTTRCELTLPIALTFTMYIPSGQR